MRHTHGLVQKKKPVQDLPEELLREPVVAHEVCFLDHFFPKSGFPRGGKRTGEKVSQIAGKEIPDFGSSPILALSRPNN